MPAKTPRLSKLELSSADPGRLAMFYRDTLGVPAKADDTGSSWRLVLGDLELILVPQKENADGSIGLTVEVTAASSEGGVLVTDPDGNRLALARTGKPKRVPSTRAKAPPKKTLGKRHPVEASSTQKTPPARRQKTIGRRVLEEAVRVASEPADLVRAPERAMAPALKKTLGKTAPTETRTPATGFLSRALVRQKIADRLAGKITASALSTWARAQWLEVQRGAPAESGQREVLEDALQSLLLSTLPPSRLTDEQLVDLMTQLGP